MLVCVPSTHKNTEDENPMHLSVLMLLAALGISRYVDGTVIIIIIYIISFLRALRLLPSLFRCRCTMFSNLLLLAYTYTKIRSIYVRICICHNMYVGYIIYSIVYV